MKITEAQSALLNVIHDTNVDYTTLSSSDLIDGVNEQLINPLYIFDKAMYCQRLPVKDIKKALRMNISLPLMSDLIATYCKFTGKSYVNLEDFTGNCKFFSFIEFVCHYCTSLCHVFVNNTSYTYIISEENGDYLYINNRLSARSDNGRNELVCELIKDNDSIVFYHKTHTFDFVLSTCIVDGEDCYEEQTNCHFIKGGREDSFIEGISSYFEGKKVSYFKFETLYYDNGNMNLPEIYDCVMDAIHELPKILSPLPKSVGGDV